MKPSVLFVDDEPNVLSGLRRSLHSMRGTWDLQFAAGGIDAMKLFDAAPVDAIVTDMRMPGMDGAAVLRQVRERSPRTIRFVLSGQTDQDVALRVAGISHQFLTKPCQTETIVAKVTEALAYRDRLPEGPIQSLVSGLHRLPSSPAIHNDLVAELDGPALSLDKLASLISRDTSLSLKFLQVANAGFFAINGEATSPRQAVVMLGVQRTRALILCHCTSWKAVHAGAELYDRLWQHSVSCGRLAHAIAVAEKMNQTNAELAFTGGLLHDVGVTALVVGDPEKYQLLLDTFDNGVAAQLEAEARLFGTNHALIGGYLAGLWGLPASVTGAIAGHHHPMAHVRDGFGVLTCVHAADALMLSPEDPSTTIDLGYLDKLGLTERLPVWAKLVADATGVGADAA